MSTSHAHQPSISYEETWDPTLDPLRDQERALPFSAPEHERERDVAEQEIDVGFDL